MKRILLIIVVAVLNSLFAQGQVNRLYMVTYSINTFLAQDAYFCADPPKGYELDLHVYSDGEVIYERNIQRKFSISNGASETFTVDKTPTNFRFSDYFLTHEEGEFPSWASYPVVFNYCGYYSTTTDYYFAYEPFDFSIIYSGEDYVCGQTPVTLRANKAPQTSYNWYVKSGTGSWILFKANAPQEINFSQSQLPASLDLTKPIYFKAATTYEGYAVETTLSPGITFYPAIPTLVDIEKTDPLCNKGTGKVKFSNFKVDKETVYDVSTDSLRITLTNTTGIGVENLVATSDTFTVKNLSSGTWEVKVENMRRSCTAFLGNFTILPEPAAITISHTITNSTCAGQPATVASTASGGSGSYTYTLKKSSDDSIVGQSNSTGTFSLAGGGTYYIEATDGNNCSPGRTSVFEIKIPDAITFTTTAKATTGIGRSDGEILVTAQGGVVNDGTTYEYQLIGVRAWQQGNNFTGLPKGTYQVQVRTSGSCVSTIEEVTIPDPEPIKVTIATVTAVSCNGYSDGSITAEASGGTSGYIFALNSNFTDSTETGEFLNKPAENYTVFVRDRDGNVASVNATITQPAKINFTTSKTDVTCYGASDGRVVITATGGVGGYMYSLDGGPFQSNNVFTNISPGTHAVTVRDNNGCSVAVDKAFTINEPVALAITDVATTEAACSGSATGSVTLAASGGSGSGYQYALNSGTYQSSPSFAGLAPGSYTASVRDGNNCTATTTFEIEAPNALTLTEDVTQRRNVTCSGGADGRIVVSSSEGTGLVKYKISSSPAENVDGIFEGLAAGTYIITATDENGCPATIKVTLTQPSELVFTSVVQHVSCNSGNDGSIVVTPAGGTQPYKYSINNGATYQTSSTFNGLLAGTYTIRVKDNNGCERSGTVTITQPQALALEVVNSRNITCYAGNDGQIQVKATGGNAAYTYTIVGLGAANTTGLFENLAAAEYLISAKDASGCEKLVNVTLSQPSQALRATFNQVTPSYDGASDGAVTVLGSGGTAPYTYALNGGAYQTDNTFTNLSSGSYIVIVKDAKGCVWEQPVVLQNPSALKLTITVQRDISCSGASDGILRATVEGGVGPYLYSINGGAAVSDPLFTGLAAGTYTIIATDSRGVAGTSVFNLVNPVGIVATYQLSPVSCYNGADGKITVSATGGKGSLKFSINGVDFQDSNTFDGLKQGAYTIFVQDEKGCTISSTRTVSQPMPLSLAIQAMSPVSCVGGDDGSITIQAQGGNGNYKYSIANGPFQASGTFSGLKAGLYSIVAEDGKGCSVQQQFELAAPEELKITGIQDTVLCKGQSVTFSAGNPGSKYQWSSDKGFSSTQSAVTLDQAGNYTLTVTNEAGCTVSTSFSVEVSTTLLKADFLMASVANVGDTIFVIDVSKPAPARTEWNIPDGVKVIHSNASGTIKQVVFDTPGTFTMQMTVGLGECADAVHKTITVLPKGQTAEAKDALGYKEELIKKFVLYPNPTSGYFRALIQLSEEQKVKLRLINYTRNHVIELKHGENEEEYTFEFNHPELAPGVYILSLEVGKEVKTLKVVKL